MKSPELKPIINLNRVKGIFESVQSLNPDLSQNFSRKSNMKWLRPLSWWLPYIGCRYSNFLGAAHSIDGNSLAQATENTLPSSISKSTVDIYRIEWVNCLKTKRKNNLIKENCHPSHLKLFGNLLKLSKIAAILTLEFNWIYPVPGSKFA